MNPSPSQREEEGNERKTDELGNKLNYLGWKWEESNAMETEIQTSMEPNPWSNDSHHCHHWCWRQALGKSQTQLGSRWEPDLGDGFRNTQIGFEGRWDRVILVHQPVNKSLTLVIPSDWSSRCHSQVGIPCWSLLPTEGLLISFPLRQGTKYGSGLGLQRSKV